MWKGSACSACDIMKLCEYAACPVIIEAFLSVLLVKTKQTVHKVKQYWHILNKFLNFGKNFFIKI